jgi:TolA-binding protein
MPRGRRRQATVNSPDVNSLEQELEQLRRRQSELRQQIRRMRNSQGEISKLEERLATQYGNAKWTVGLIRQIRPDWDEWGFYQSIQAKPPTPRGRRRRSAEGGEGES